ncbi:cytidine deaminase [Candidatus Peregrinibacteria bacterium]|nr:cytidine deaminase [Candidatus Peregrinibacteria bacterium]
MTRKILEIAYDEYENIDELPNEEEIETIEAAEDALKNNGHSPYSGFNVRAAVRTKTGKIFIGKNYENAAYGSTICAERAAILEASNHGHINDINIVAITGKSDECDSTEPIDACGSCRQVLVEAEQISGEEITIIAACTNGKIRRIVGMDNYLPFNFGPKHLGMV